MKYTYLLRRPFDIGTYPKEGFESHSIPEWIPQGSYEGVLTYSKPLSIDQIKKYELIPLSEINDVFGNDVVVYIFDTEDLDEGYYYLAARNRIGKTMNGYSIRLTEFDPKTSENFGERQITAGEFLDKIRSGKWKKLNHELDAYDQIIEFKEKNKGKTPDKGSKKYEVTAETEKELDEFFGVYTRVKYVFDTETSVSDGTPYMQIRRNRNEENTAFENITMTEFSGIADIVTVEISPEELLTNIKTGKWKELYPGWNPKDQITQYRFDKRRSTPVEAKGDFESKLKVLNGILLAKSYGTYNLEEQQFGEEVVKKLKAKEKIVNRTSLENLAFKKYNIVSPKTTKEMVEASTFFASDEIVKNGKKHNLDRYVIYQLLLGNYELQANLTARFSETVQYQQYSTPYPICYLMSEFVGLSNKGEYFEPTAGNGGLTIGADRKNFVVNEIDKFRVKTLNLFDYKYTIMSDATDTSLYKAFPKRFDGVIGNPPFGTMSEKLPVNGFSAKFKNLERYILLWSLTTMKKQGRLAFIIGGHFQKSEKSNEPLRDVDLVFLTNIAMHYKISDVINIKGDLYAKMGTKFDVCLILIDGAIESPMPVSFFNTDEPTKAFSTMPVTTFKDLFVRVTQHI